MRFVFPIILIVLCLSVKAQRNRGNTDFYPSLTVSPPIPQSSLDSFNMRRSTIARRGMYVLGGWGAASLVSGAVAAPITTGSVQYFNISNAIWGGTNLLISIPGMIGNARKRSPMGLTLGKSLQRQQQTERIFLVNAGIDLAYIGGGGIMWALANQQVKTRNQDILAGVGSSFVAQGAVLLSFDWAMFLINHFHFQHGMNKYTAGLALDGNGIGYKLAF